MIAILNTSVSIPWVDDLEGTPWALLPIANRSLLDYWLETLMGQQFDSVQLVLGEGAKQIEDFAGDGRRWNLCIQYSFARSGERQIDYIKSVSNQWENGMLYMGGSFFLRRRKGYRPSGFKSLQSCRHGSEDGAYFLFGRNGDEIREMLDGAPGSLRGLEQIHVQPFEINDIATYFRLNMNMVMGEFSRYVTAGFSGKDGSSIGYNVWTPPSSDLRAPILVGDDCRFGSMTTVGPNAVVANHVIVDAHSELSDCLILPDTYIGRNLDIRRKIVAGNRLISPDDGTVVEIDDSWLVAKNRPNMRTEDLVRYIILWFFALGLAVLQFLPFCILYPLVRLSRIAIFERKLFHDPGAGYIKLPVFRKLENRRSPVYSMFRALSLDRFPWLLLVLRGRLFLCGQPPMLHPDDDEIIKQLSHYYPGVFCYQDYNKESDTLVDSLWYAHIRSLFEDVKILIKSLLSRFLRAGR